MPFYARMSDKKSMGNFFKGLFIVYPFSPSKLLFWATVCAPYFHSVTETIQGFLSRSGLAEHQLFKLL